MFLIPLYRLGGAVPLPRAVPRVPAGRVQPCRARRYREAATGGRRLGHQGKGSPAMAVEHLLNTTERSRCVELVNRAGPTHLPGRPDVDRGASGSPHSAPPRSSVTPRSPYWPATSRCSPDRAPKRNGGRRSSTPHRSTWLQRTARHPSSRPEQCSEPLDVRRRPGTNADRRECGASHWSHRGAPGATPPCAFCAVRRVCSPATSTGPARCSSRLLALAITMLKDPDTFVDSEAELAVLAMDHGRWGSGRRTRETRIRRGLRASDARLRHQRARLRRLYRAKTRSQARDLEIDPSTGQGMITRWPRDCST